MRYFENFKLIPFTFDSNFQNWTYVKNIFTRVSFLDNIINNASVYYEYDMQDSDNFEHISYKYYNDIDKFWILLFTNQIMDPFYQGVLKTEPFINYIDAKYMSVGGNTGDGVVAAQSTIDHYELQTTTKVTASNGFISSNTTTTYYDANTYAIYDIRDPTRDPTDLPTIEHSILPFVSPPTAYVTVGTQQFTVNQSIQLVAVSAYDTELTANENRRHINIIKKEYVEQIEQQFSNLVST
jgi:Base plate wedge protein 53